MKNFHRFISLRRCLNDYIGEDNFYASALYEGDIYGFDLIKMKFKTKHAAETKK